MNKPKVSFIVPCYKLAHLLGECVESILQQSYTDFEILIMDDCSPDKTAEVAASFRDSRIVYVRNEQNLGHLANYNRGIELAHGEYIWLISADDRIRVPYLLERYVSVMESSPRLGYACCPAMKLRGSTETEIDGSLGHGDRIYSGAQFLDRLLGGNFIPAASGMVRRACYERCGAFPLDLPYAGDWYLWLLFALHFDVAYFAEPMVNYRAHELSMTNFLMTNRDVEALREGFLVLWRIRKEAERLGIPEVVRKCDSCLARLYAQHLAGGVCEGKHYLMTETEMADSLRRHSTNEDEKNRMEAKIWVAAGDRALKQKKFEAAGKHYGRALHYKYFQPAVHARRLLVSTGSFAPGLVHTLAGLRRLAVR